VANASSASRSSLTPQQLSNSLNTRTQVIAVLGSL
jgi:hypothetical protein